MKPSTYILLRSLGKSFYRENGGLILFLLFIMFAAVGRANETGLLEYHYNLIIGMLHNTDMFLLVLLLWILYTLRSISFILRTRRNPAFAFLSEYARCNRTALFSLLLLLQVVFFIPVISYAAIIVVIAFRLQLAVSASAIMAILVVLILLPALWNTFLFSHPGMDSLVRTGEKKIQKYMSGYWRILTRYVSTQKKTLFLAIKIFSTGLLWGVLRQLAPGDQELRMPVLFFCFGLFGHSVLLFDCREMEERGLNFYRGLPVPIGKRLLDYCLFIFLLFLPETMLLILFTPARLAAGNSLMLFGLGFGILLLLNSILFIRSFKKADFLKCCGGIFLFVFIAVLTGILPALAVAAPLLAVILFFRSFYRFEVSSGQQVTDSTA